VPKHIIPLGMEWNIIVWYKFKNILLTDHEHQEKELEVKEKYDIQPKHKDRLSKDKVFITNENEWTYSVRKKISSKGKLKFQILY
jgi:hypothetical protein